MWKPTSWWAKDVLESSALLHERTDWEETILSAKAQLPTQEKQHLVQWEYRNLGCWDDAMQAQAWTECPQGEVEFEVCW